MKNPTSNEPSRLSFKSLCPRCQGKGRVVSERCFKCDAAGYVPGVVYATLTPGPVDGDGRPEA